MSIKKLLVSIIIASVFPVMGQTTSLERLHLSKHHELLSNAKTSSIDKSVIEEYFRHELESREGDKENPTEEELMMTDLIKEAASHLGKRYRSGGKGPNSFDCSGFVGYVYKQFGYQIGGSSRDQYQQGKSVEKEDLRPGDLVFFTGRNSQSGRVGHVGIVVEADNKTGQFKFIHASTSGGIKYDSNTGYYGRRYLGARRLTDNQELLK